MTKKANQLRAARANHVLHFYVVDEIDDAFDAGNLKEDLACLIADFRHYCDERSVDFQDVLNLAKLHYEVELRE